MSTPCHDGTGGEAKPGVQDQRQLVRLAQARWHGPEHVEPTRLEFAEQPPIDRTHQFGRHHRPAILGGQSFARQPVVVLRPRGHAPGQSRKALGVFVPENLRLRHVE
jgi:hypothetical protein